MRVCNARPRLETSMREHHRLRRAFVVLFAAAFATAAATRPAAAQYVIREIINASGDGVQSLDGALGIALDRIGNAYVAGVLSQNAFRVTPGGTIARIIDVNGDGLGHGIDGPFSIATDPVGNAYVVGGFSGNAFKITPGGTVTE